MAGLAVFGGALLVGACLWLLRPKPVEMVVDVRASATAVASIVREPEADTSVANVQVDESPA